MNALSNRQLPRRAVHQGRWWRVALLRRPGVVAAAISLVLHVSLLCWGLGMWTASRARLVPPPPEQARIRLSLLPPAAPPMPVAPRQAPTPTPERVARAARPPQAEPAPRVPRPRAAVPLLPPASQQAPVAPGVAMEGEMEAPAMSASMAAAPPSPSLPPGPAAGMRDPSWESRVLARLERFRRYPHAARARRIEGVAYVRTQLDRGGRVLAARLQRSSGSAVLDAEALATFQRSQPLPAPPETLPVPVELDVPVEFFLR